MFEALAGLTGIGLFALKIRRDNKRYLEAEMRRLDGVPEEEFERIRQRIQAQKDRYRAEQLQYQEARDAELKTGTPFEQYVKQMQAAGRGDIADRADKSDMSVRY